MNKIKNIFYTLILISVFYSCSSSKMIDKKEFKIDGIYNANPISNKIQNFNHYNFISLLNRKLLKDTLKEKPIFNYKFKIEILDKKHLKISVLNEVNKVVKTNRYKFKVKEDYLILKNKNVKPILIPYLAGALDITKLKINSDENKNLNVIINNHRSGGVFLIPMGWSNDKRIEKYQRVE